ncbi:MAG: tripartite tricarboxylate transporter TctB family protein [Betaproteobacteria bacterium]|nr:tripartite tricarboxylate transporter TctB family protein [Betaproteobacteria bacterium]
MRIKSPRDFWAGLMFIGFGLGFLFIAVGPPAFLVELAKQFDYKFEYGYQMGTAVRMGPAYFPTVLGGMLAALGLFVLIESLAIEGEKVARFYFRPLLFIVAANLAFAYLLKPLGVMLSIAVLVFISAYGGHEFKWKEVALLAIAMMIMSVLVFVKGLTLPFPIWPAFME